MSADLNQLCPEARALCVALIQQAAAEGVDARAIQTWRSKAQQQVLYDTGKSHARPDFDPHCVVDKDKKPASEAFDIGCFDSTGAYITDENNLAYSVCQDIGRSLGLDCGVDWKSFKDPDHFNLKSWVWGVSRA